MEWNKKTGSKSGFQRQPMGLFSQRSQKVETFDWHNVDRLALVAAFCVCSQSGATLSIAPGNGGVGVTVRLYQGERGDSAYASNASQMNELCELVIAKMGSTAEDVKLSIAGMPMQAVAAMPAD